MLIEKFSATVTRKLRAFGLVFTVAAMAPMAMQADCLPQAPQGYYVPFTMSTHSNRDASGLVSYTPYDGGSGTLTVSNSYPTYSLSGDGYEQLFSDRTANLCPGGLIACSQPFSYTQPDRVGLTISENVSTHVINVTFKLDTWNAEFSFQGHCDAISNLLHGSVNNSVVGAEMIVISFGTPIPPPQ